MADPAPDDRGRRRSRSAGRLLIAVCVLHALSPLFLIGGHIWFGWDETTYISQYSAHAPPGWFSPPRARGMPLLVAPVSWLTGNLLAIRIYLAALSGICMYVGFAPWQRLRPGYTIPLAAFLFSSLWTTVFYGFEAMPNEYVAFGALAASGCVLLAQRESGRRQWAVCAGIAVGFTALVRPTDSVFLILPLLVVVARRRARWRPITVALGAGFAAGWADWLIEAVTSFGGPVARLHDASAENTGGLHFALAAEVRALAGPILCRGTCHTSAPMVDRLWFFALVPLAALAVWSARRNRKQREELMLAMAVAVTLGMQYLLLISYAAPRFLTPSYALLSIPVATGLGALPGLSLSARHAVGAAVVAAVVGHVLVQASVLRRDVVPSARTQAARNKAIGDWLGSHGVRGPCLVLGDDGAPIGYQAGCRSSPLDPVKAVAEWDRGKVDLVVVCYGRPRVDSPFPASTTISAPMVPRGWRATILPRLGSGSGAVNQRALPASSGLVDTNSALAAGCRT